MSLTIERVEKGILAQVSDRISRERAIVSWKLGNGEIVELTPDGRLTMIGVAKDEEDHQAKPLAGVRSREAADMVNWHVLEPGDVVILGESPYTIKVTSKIPKPQSTS